MTTHVAADTFRRAVGLALAATSKNSPVEAYKSIRCEFQESTGKVEAFNGEWSVSASVAGVESQSDTPLVYVVPAAKLMAVADTSGDSTIRLSPSGNNLQASCGRSRYTLPTMNSADWPVLKVGSDLPVSCVVDAGDLEKAVERTSFAIEATATRYALGGICLDLSGERAMAVATDSKRLSVLPLHATREEGWATGTHLLPVAPLKLASKLEGSVAVSVSSATARLSNGVVEIRTRVIDGRYPKYLQAIPQSRFEIAIAARPLLEALRQASRFVPPESVTVAISIQGGELVVSSGGGGAGHCELSLPVPFDGEFHAEVVPGFLIDCLGKAGDEIVSLGVIDSESAMTFTIGDWTYVVMPVVRDQKGKKE